MGLSAGTRLGPYEITAPLGAGGMGEVYRATDARLNRTVAIKILSDESSADMDRRERFEREAKAISALDHPNICALFDVGDHGGAYFLVMPCLDGETLADRLSRGPLSAEQAIKYAVQISSGIDAAHRRGIVHRDLKPANIMLTRTGVKLLDFGLAKLRKAAGPLGTTTLASGTGIGTLLGTMPYMSPEQIEGRDVDPRSDIFSLGAVIYEMVTGQRAFKGETAGSVIGAIMKDDPPPMRTLQPLTPVALDHVVSTCLQKDPDERWQSAADVAHELRWIAEGTEPLVRTEGPRRRLWTAAGAAALAGLIALTMMWPRSDVPSRSNTAVMRLSILPPAGGRFSNPPASVVAPQLALSPSGQHVAFVAEIPGSRPHIWLRSLDAAEPRMLPGTNEAQFPFWSPDSRSLGFFAEGKLKTITIVGGSPVTLSDAPLDSRGGSWNAENTIIFSPSATDVIYRIAATGGAATPVTRFDATRAETSHRFPRFLPDGRHFIYVVRGNTAENWGISLASLDDPTSHVIAPGLNLTAQVTASGAFLFQSGTTLLARPFDATQLKPTGEPIAIADDVGLTATAYGAFSASASGDVVFGSQPRFAGELQWFARDGTPLGVAAPLGEYLDFELSPDERTLAFSRVDHQQNLGDVWTMDLERQISTRITSDSMNDASVIWSPDDTRLVFRSNRFGNSDLFQIASNPAGQLENVLLRLGSNVIPTDWSGANRRIVFTNTRSINGFDLWTWDADTSAKPELVVRTRLNASHGRFSPDGRWLAFASDESGRWQVYVQPFPATGEKKQISVTGGSEPRWRHDGRELYFLNASQEIVAVPIPDGNAFAPGTTKVLFKTHPPLTESVYRTNYTVSRDGQRFLVNAGNGQAMTEPLTMIFNWPALLKKTPD